MKKSFILVLCFLGFQCSWAAWGPSNGPVGGTVYCLNKMGSWVFGGTNGGVYRSVDGTASWINLCNGIPSEPVYALASAGDTLWAGFSALGVFTSVDKGVNWTVQNQGLSNPNICALLKTGRYLFAGTGAGLFRCDVHALSWITVFSGIPAIRITAMQSHSGYLYAGTAGMGIYRSMDNGDNWNQVNNGLTDADITCLADSGTYLYAGTQSGKVFMLNGTEEQWGSFSTGLPSAIPVAGIIPLNGSLFLASSTGGVYKSEAAQPNWQPYNTGLANQFLHSILSFNEHLITGTDGGGFYLSPQTSPQWEPRNTGFARTGITSMITTGNTVFAGTKGAGLFFSSDNGSTWISATNGIPNPFITSLLLTEDRLFAGTKGNGVFRSENNGNSWIPANTGMNNLFVTSLLFDDSALFSGTMRGLYKSTDLGSSWEQVLSFPADIVVNTLCAVQGNILAGTDTQGVYFSNDYGTTWDHQNNGLPQTPVLNSCGFENKWLIGTSVGIFSTENADSAWTVFPSPLDGLPVSFLRTYNSALFSGDATGNLYLFTPYENKWDDINTGFSNTSEKDVVVSMATALAGTVDNSVWKETVTNLFTFEANPDTLLLNQVAGSQDTLFVHTSMNWTIIGSMPSWLNSNVTSGNGEGFVTFTSTEDNMSAFPRSTELFAYCPYLGNLPFTVVQKGKNTGINDPTLPPVRFFLSARNDRLLIESAQTIQTVSVYDLAGKKIREIYPGSTSVEVNLSEFNPGFCMLMIEGKDWKTLKKMIIP